MPLLHIGGILTPEAYPAYEAAVLKHMPERAQTTLLGLLDHFVDEGLPMRVELESSEWPEAFCAAMADIGLTTWWRSATHCCLMRPGEMEWWLEAVHDDRPGTWAAVVRWHELDHLDDDGLAALVAAMRDADSPQPLRWPDGISSADLLRALAESRSEAA